MKRSTGIILPILLAAFALRVWNLSTQSLWWDEAFTWQTTGHGLVNFWLSRTVRRRLGGDAAAATSLAALGFLAKLAIWAVVLLVALDNMGVSITTLVAGLGITGIAVALGVQSVFKDVFASLSIIVDKPFVIGDFIAVGDLGGTVERIGLKTTRVRSLSGEEIVFSNGDLLIASINSGM